MIKHTQPLNLDNRPVHAGQTIPEPRAFRDALGHYASGITIIAGHDGVEPLGFTCQSFYSVSLNPPLISFSVTSNSSTYPRNREIFSQRTRPRAASAGRSIFLEGKGPVGGCRVGNDPLP